MTISRKTTFGDRAEHIARRRIAVGEGGELHIGPDGLLTVRRRRQGLKFPLRGLLIVVCTAFLAKTGLYLHLGPVTYSDKIAILEQGSAVEKAGARLMATDPVMLAIADVVTPYLN